MGDVDYSNLRREMQRNGLNQKALAALAGISEGQFCKKMTGEYPFKQTEILKICDILHIDYALIADYFFCKVS